MTIDKRVLLVGRADSALAGVLDELDVLGFRVVWLTSLPSALDFIKANQRVSLVIASAQAASDGVTNFCERSGRSVQLCLSFGDPGPSWNPMSTASRAPTA